MLQKLFATFLVLVCFIGSYSQDSVVAATEEPAPKPVISGSVDVYYRYNFANAKNVNG